MMKEKDPEKPLTSLSQVRHLFCSSFRQCKGDVVLFGFIFSLSLGTATKADSSSTILGLSKAVTVQKPFVLMVEVGRFGDGS